MVYTTLQLIISKEEAMENILMCKAEKEKQLVPDTINNGRDRHRTKNYAAFSTSNFQICRICGKSRSISQCYLLFLGLLGSLTTTRPLESMPVRTMKCPL